MFGVVEGLRYRCMYRVASTACSEADDLDEEAAATSTSAPSAIAPSLRLHEPHSAWATCRTHVQRSLQFWQQALAVDNGGGSGSSGQGGSSRAGNCTQVTAAAAAQTSRGIRFPKHSLHTTMQLWHIAGLQGLDGLQQQAAAVITAMQQRALVSDCKVTAYLAEALAGMPRGLGWTSFLLAPQPVGASRSLILICQDSGFQAPTFVEFTLPLYVVSNVAGS